MDGCFLSPHLRPHGSESESGEALQEKSAQRANGLQPQTVSCCQTLISRLRALQTRLLPHRGAFCHLGFLFERQTAMFATSELKHVSVSRKVIC